MQPVQPPDHQTVRLLPNIHPGVAQDAHRRAQMIKPSTAQEDGTAGDRGGAGIAAGFDPIRNDRMIRAVQSVDTLDSQRVGADAFDPRAHRDQTGGQIADLRLPRRIGQHGSAVGQAGRHQQVFRRADRHEREDDLRAAQPPVDPPVDITRVQVEPRAHLFQALQVQIHRAGADRAAAGQRYPRLPDTGQQRAEHEDGGAHFADDVVGCLGIRDRAADRQHPPGIAHGIDGDAVLRQQRAHGLDVGEARHIAEYQAIRRQQPRRHQRQGGVLCPADRDFTRQRPSAANSDPVHCHILGSAVPRWPMYLPALSA